MEILYYLNEKEVERAFFKQFSSRCNTWVKLLSQYEQELSRKGGVLKLIYMPSVNDVRLYCSERNGLVELMKKQAALMLEPEMAFNSFVPAYS